MKSTPGKNWTSASAILAGCLVTLLGVANGLDPDVILWRAIVSGTIIGVTVCIVVRLLASVLENQ